MQNAKEGKKGGGEQKQWMESMKGELEVINS